MSVSWQQFSEMSEREVAALGMRFAPAWLRREILERDGYQCVYCHRPVTMKTANIDHKKPWPWGMTERSNLQSICRDCNRDKGTRSSPRQPKPKRKKFWRGVRAASRMLR